MRSARTNTLAFIFGSLLFLTPGAAFADGVVNVTIPEVTATSKTAASASGICNPAGGALTVTFYDGNGHSVSPAVAPTCTGGGTWSTIVNLSSLDDGTNHADVVQGVNSDLNVAFQQDTVLPFLDSIFVYDGTFAPDINGDLQPDMNGTQSIYANGYTFSTTTPSFELASNDVSLGTLTCKIDSGVGRDCATLFYWAYEVALSNGTHTLHIDMTDSVNNAAATSSTFCINTCAGDITAPVIAAHADVSVTTTSSSGVAVTYTNPSATDNTDPVVTVTCLPASGTTFAVGNTTVTCSAQDAALNSAVQVTFTVRVTLEIVAQVGNGAPVGLITVPSNVPQSAPIVAPASSTPASAPSPAVPSTVATNETPSAPVGVTPAVVKAQPRVAVAAPARESAREDTVAEQSSHEQIPDERASERPDSVGLNYFWVLFALLALFIAGVFVWNTYWGVSK